jgi:hypothetical protein
VSIPDAELWLSAEEKAELDWLKQHPRFHQPWKCGNPLTAEFVKKRHARIKLYLCTVHGARVTLSGWEVGFYEGEPSSDLNP